MKCERHGLEFEQVNRDVLLKGPYGSFEGYVDCPKCAEEYRRRSLARNVQAAHIPPRFIGKGFDSFGATTPAQKCALEVARDYADRFEEHEAAGRCLVFSGKVGTGKTHLACAIAEALIRAEQRPYYSTAAELIRLIRSAWRKDSEEDESKILGRIQKIDLLILDEIGVKGGGDADVQQLTEVIDLRYREIRPTLVVSNYSMEDMGKFLGERGVDRLKENGGKVAIFNWEGRRK
jgi:DNA replication protein DnaC